MLEVDIRFTTGRTAFTDADLMERGQKTFVCPECDHSHTYYSMFPARCENLSCRRLLPNMDMINRIYSRMKYHFGLKDDNELEEMMAWERVPSMYARL
jgi:hypothetical protein